MEKTDNRSQGGRFEQELAEILAGRGFWVHVIQQNKAGQPADIIAAKGKFHTLIDCKLVSDDKGFLFKRVEPNQRLAMRRFTRRCGELCYFAIKATIEGKEEIRMVSLGRIETLEGRGIKQFSMKSLANETWSLEKWLDASDTWGEDI